MTRNAILLLARLFVVAVAGLAWPAGGAAEDMVLIESTPVTADNAGTFLSGPLRYNHATGNVALDSPAACEGYFFIRREHSLTLQYALREEAVLKSSSFGSSTQRTWIVSQMEKDGRSVGGAEHKDVLHGLSNRKILWTVDDKRDILHIEKYRMGEREVHVLSVETRWSDRISGIKKYTGDIITSDGVVYAEWRINGEPIPESVIQLLDFFRACDDGQ